MTLFTRLAGRFDAYVELEDEAPGWVAGNPYRSAQLTTRLGVAGRLF